MHFHSLDPHSSLLSPIHRVAPAIKMLAAFLCVGFAIACPKNHLPFLIIPTAFLILIAILSRISLLFLLKRILLLEPLVLGAGLMVLFQPDGVKLFAILCARCTLCLLSMTLLSNTTPFADILQIFRKIHAPTLLLTTLALMHRYLFVLADESARMRRARACRTFTPQKTFVWRTFSSVITQLFLRASERAQRIYDAMRARGWEDS
jgi:cobalt/nickel transport system permease protein